MLTRGFPAEEYEARWQRLSAAMTDAGLDAVLVTSEPNFRYFSGFDSQTWVSTTRPRYLILRRDAAPVAVVPSSNAPGMKERTPVDDIRTWAAPNPGDEGVTKAAATLREAARRFGAVGVELGPESRVGMPGGDFLTLLDALRPLEIRDAVPLIAALRMVKTPSEVERIATIAEIVSEGFAALPALARGRRTLREVCQALTLDLLRRGADKTPYLVGESGEGGYDNLIMGPDDRVLAPGHVVFIDTGSTFDGYFCDFDRNFMVGPPVPPVRDAHDIAFRATEAGIAAVRPGRTTGDVWRAMADVINASGARTAYVGRMGHGLGLSLTEPPSIHPTDRTVLVPGMVLTLEPSLTYQWQSAAGTSAKLMVHEEFGCC